MGKRTRYSADFKARVVIEAIRGELTLSELAAKHGLSSRAREARQ
jgi:transposase